MGVRLLQKEVAGANYEEQFLEALLELKAKGVKGVVFGDIDVQQNRQWCEMVCRKAGLKSYFPLWNIDQKTILSDFLDCGFKAAVVALDSRFLNESNLGSLIDKKWLRYLSVINASRRSPQITSCGENGEYHTFVFDGPAFRFPIDFRLGEKVYREGFWLVDLRPSEEEDSIKR
jgi:uncharacterized protein (TIGR00290 family)